jgi:hypothetical protein
MEWWRWMEVAAVLAIFLLAAKFWLFPLALHLMQRGLSQINRVGVPIKTYLKTPRWWLSGKFLVFGGIAMLILTSGVSVWEIGTSVRKAPVKTVPINSGKQAEDEIQLMEARYTFTDGPGLRARLNATLEESQRTGGRVVMVMRPAGNAWYVIGTRAPRFYYIPASFYVDHG